MKRIVLALVALGSLPATAFADCEARKNTELPCDPDLVRSGYYAREAYYAQLNTPVHGPFTTEQVNRALQWLGRPEHEQIGRAKVLHDDSAPAAGVTRREMTIHFR